MDRIGFSFSQRSLAEQIHSRLDSVAYHRQFLLNLFINKVNDQLHLVTSRTRLRQFLYDYHYGEIEIDNFLNGTQKILRDAGNSVPAFIDIMITDFTGKVITATDDSKTGRDFSDNNDFKQGQTGTHIGSPFLENYLYLAFLFEPVTANDGLPLGTAVVKLNLHEFIEILFDRNGLGNTGEVRIASREGLYYRDLLPEKETGRTQLIEIDKAPALRLAVDDQNSGFGVQLFDGRKVLSAWRPFHYQSPDIRQWGLVVNIDESEAFKPIDELVEIQLWMECTLVLVGIIAALWLSRNLTLPIINMQRASRLISQGNFNINIPVESSDELGALAADMNSMSARLSDTHNRLQQRTNELEKTNELLVRSNRDLEQLTYISSHDLQTPLRSIAGFSQLLHKYCAQTLDEKAKEYCTRIVNNVSRMQVLINDLSLFFNSRLQNEIIKRVSIDRLFDEVCAANQTLIDENEAVVTRDNLPAVAGDNSQLTQVLQNLLINAITYRSKSRPRIHLSAKRNNREIVFALSDNGIGIDMNHSTKIFEMFRRLHTQESYPGTGLGLAVCRRIIEHHGGKIWFESGVNQGTTFFFTLPEWQMEDT